MFFAEYGEKKEWFGDRSLHGHGVVHTHTHTHLSLRLFSWSMCTHNEYFYVCPWSFFVALCSMSLFSPCAMLFLSSVFIIHSVHHAHSLTHLFLLRHLFYTIIFGTHLYIYTERQTNHRTMEEIEEVKSIKQQTIDLAVAEGKYVCECAGKGGCFLSHHHQPVQARKKEGCVDWGKLEWFDLFHPKQPTGEYTHIQTLSLYHHHTHTHIRTGIRAAIGAGCLAGAGVFAADRFNPW